MNFIISGTLRLTCDRCLGEFDMPVKSEEEYFIKFGPEHKEEDDNVLIITDNETHIDIAPLLFDYLSLMVPYKVVHPDNEKGESLCDPEALKRIEQLSAHKEKDQRWDVLKDLNLE